MAYPRLGTPAGDRALAAAQRAYDNMTPDDCDDEEDVEKVICCSAEETCGDCEHAGAHDKTGGCEAAMCAWAGHNVQCQEEG